MKAKELFVSPTAVCSDEELSLVIERLPQSESEIAGIFGPITAAAVASDIIGILYGKAVSTN